MKSNDKRTVLISQSSSPSKAQNQTWFKLPVRRVSIHTGFVSQPAGRKGSRGPGRPGKAGKQRKWGRQVTQKLTVLASGCRGSPKLTPTPLKTSSFEYKDQTIKAGKIMSRSHPRFLYCYYKKIKVFRKTKPCPNCPFVLQTAASGSRLHRSAPCDAKPSTAAQPKQLQDSVKDYPKTAGFLH